MLMSKKGGVGLEWPRILINVIIVTIIVAFIFITVFMNLNEKIMIEDTKQKISFYTLTSTESCLAYADENGVHPGYINVEKITKDYLESCMLQEGAGYGVKLKNSNGNTITSVEIKNGIYDEDRFQICEIYREEYLCESFSRFVQYKNNNKWETGVLTMEVISKNG